MKARWWYGFTSVAILVFGLSTYLLIERSTSQELWGHLPLFQFSAFWIGIISVLCRKWKPTETRTKHLALSILSAALLSLGFPPFLTPILLFAGFVPLLFILDEHRKKGLSSLGSVFFFSFNTFLLWNIWTTYWVANTAYAAGIFANVVNSLLMTIPVLLYYFVIRRLGPNVGLVALATLWISFEFLHMRWELYWPWLTLGNGLSTLPGGIQWYEFSGALGGSLWILIINYLLFSYLQSPREKLSSSLPVFLWLIVPIMISQWIGWRSQINGNPVNVVIVQPNFEPHYEKFHVPEEALLKRFVSLAETEVDDETDYLIFPETSFNRMDMDRIADHEAILQLRAFQDRFSNLKIVTGIAGYRWLTDPDEQQLPTTRILTDSYGQPAFVETYNCAVQISPDGTISEYYKALFVPGAEFFPFRKILFFFKPLVDKLGGTIAGYRTRTEFAVFESDSVVAAPAICYESIFGEFMSRFIGKDANVIFVMTNDGWWDNTAGHRQHALFGRLRAIELRRQIARAANMGTCSFIDEKGGIHEPTQYGVAQAVSGTIFTNDKVTFYARWGDFIGRLSLFISVLLILRSVMTRFVK